MSKRPNYTTNIPHARKGLLEIAGKIEDEGLHIEAAEIRSLVENHMIRRPGMRRAPSTRNEVTEIIRLAVISDLQKTDLPQEDIAKKYNIDGGRVSEINRALRN